MATYYIDTNSLATATGIWTNVNLTVKAADGFYQKDGVYRQISGGELLPVQNCPNCFYAFGSSLVEANSAAACDSTITETYYFENVDGGVGETEPEIGDLVYSDSEGTTPLGAGFYKIVSGVYIEVNSSGEVIAKGSCSFCYVYEYINTTESTTFSFGPYPLCPGPGVFDIQITPGMEGVTFCIEQLSQETINQFNAMGLTLTEGPSICNS